MLRDKSGAVQLLLSEEHTKNFQLISRTLKSESCIEGCITVSGQLVERPPGMSNNQIPLGNLEMAVEDMTILNTATKLPFLPNTYGPLPEEEIRLAHRHLDLRRPLLQRNLKIRSEINSLIRRFMESAEFVEIETPLLFRSTPEGAREFLVSADRISPGHCFALPQSPQQFKQMLMAAGFDRYYQIARCFRDEDLRADRQPEFTQLDIEMSFVTMNEVMDLMESLMKHIWSTYMNLPLLDQFPRITYAEAMSLYGSDKPDCRYQIKIETLEQDQATIYECLRILDSPSSPEWLDLNDFSPEDWLSLKPLLETGNVEIGAPKQLASLFQSAIVDRNVTFNVRRDRDDHGAWTILGKIRNHLIKRLERKGLNSKYQISKGPSFVWIYDFPLFSRNTEKNDLFPKKKYESLHHPFTCPHPDDIQLLDSNPLGVRGLHYDLVLDGSEIGGGSMRIHSAQLQEHILKNIMQVRLWHPLLTTSSYPSLMWKISDIC